MLQVHSFTYKIGSNMKKNLGSTDRVIRVVIATMFVALYFTGIIAGIVGLALIALSGIFILTSLVGFCPLYFPFGINTSGRKTTNRY